MLPALGAAYFLIRHRKVLVGLFVLAGHLVLIGLQPRDGGGFE